MILIAGEITDKEPAVDDHNQEIGIEGIELNSPPRLEPYHISVHSTTCSILEDQLPNIYWVLSLVWGPLLPPPPPLLGGEKKKKKKKGELILAS